MKKILLASLLVAIVLGSSAPAALAVENSALLKQLNGEQQYENRRGRRSPGRRSGHGWGFGFGYAPPAPPPRSHYYRPPYYGPNYYHAPAPVPAPGYYHPNPGVVVVPAPPAYYCR